MDFIAKSTSLMAALQKTMFHFIWNKKKIQDRISRKVTVRTIAKGGLAVPTVRPSINALKLSWIQKLKASDHKWKGNNYINLPKSSLLRNSIVHKFWIHIFKSDRVW